MRKLQTNELQEAVSMLNNTISSLEGVCDSGRNSPVRKRIIGGDVECFCWNEPQVSFSPYLSNERLIYSLHRV
jgi:hypothetical protein